MKNENINIDQFAQRVAKSTSMDHKKTKQFITSLFKLTAEHLQKEERVPIHRLGIFKRKWVDDKTGTNPQTGEKMNIPGHFRVLFSPSSSLADKVNKRYRGLKPNVLDEILTLTGINRQESGKGQKKQGKDSVEIQEQKRRVRRRAVISIMIILVFLCIFLGAVITVPIYYINQNNRIIAFVSSLNEMMGLSGISQQIQEGMNETIDSDQATEFIRQSREKLLSAAEREILTVYEVNPGDTIFGLARDFWGNENLWPDLYIMNREKFSDPDLIFPGDTINIYKQLGVEGRLSRKEKEALVQAYLGVYRIYRALGEEKIEAGNQAEGERRKNDAVWVLYVAAGYDPNLLRKYEGAIYPSDEEMLKKFIEEFGIWKPKRIQISFFGGR